MATFVYPSLGEWHDIRTLELQPGSQLEDPLIGKLNVHSMYQEPKYVVLPNSSRMYKPKKYAALSYTWGPGIENEELSDDSIILSNIPFRLTGNLGRALRQLRHALVQSSNPTGPILLWIDAICINQRDLHEKGRQVSMMNAIYKLASQVVVWLGDESTLGDSEFIFTFSESVFNRQIEHDDIRLKRIADFCSRWSDSDLVAKLRAFIRRRYFTRRWIVQELHHASSVHLFCGRFDAPWIRLIRVLDHLQSYLAQDKAASTEMITVCEEARLLLIRLRRMRQPDTEFLQVEDVLPTLCTFQNLECDDPRDKLFALSSTWRRNKDPLLQVDYGLSPDALYFRFASNLLATHTIASDQILMVAAYQTWNSARNDTIRDIPSWVPDWRFAVPEHSMFDDRRYHISNSTTILDGTTLKITLRVFGCVTYREHRSVQIKPQALLFGEEGTQPQILSYSSDVKSGETPETRDHSWQYLDKFCPSLAPGDIICVHCLRFSATMYKGEGHFGCENCRMALVVREVPDSADMLDHGSDLARRKHRIVGLFPMCLTGNALEYYENKTVLLV